MGPMGSTYIVECRVSMFGITIMIYLGPFESRFLSSTIIIRVPFFLLFGFNKGTRKAKGQKGTTQKPRS